MTKTRIPLFFALALSGLIGFVAGNGRAAADDLQNFGKRIPSKEEVINALKLKPGPVTRKIEEHVLALPVVTFDINSANLTPQAKQALDVVGSAFTDELHDYKFQIEGHTDSTGSAAYNQRLSERRAESVARYLEDRWQVPSWRLRTAGKGESEPLPHKSPEDPENRRTQFRTLGK